MQQQEQIAAVILIVEDHRVTRLLVERVISNAFPACRLLAAESAEQALELCASDAPHVVVMDILLPGMDGIEATRRVKALRPDTCVVIHSSHDIQIYREGSAAAGAAAFVDKSRTLTDLVPAIRRCLVR